jgi:transcriptional regulator with XRE-family HTH domain
MGRPTKTNNRQVGERLRQLRILRGLTLEDLGKTVGVSYQQMQKYETGFNALSLVRMQRCAESLGVTMHYFLNGPDEEEPQIELSRQKILRLMKALQQLEKQNPAMLTWLYKFIVKLVRTKNG